MLPCPGESHRHNYCIVYFIEAAPYKLINLHLSLLLAGWVITITMYRWYVRKRAKNNPAMSDCLDKIRHIFVETVFNQDVSSFL